MEKKAGKKKTVRTALQKKAMYVAGPHGGKVFFYIEKGLIIKKEREKTHWSCVLLGK